MSYIVVDIVFVVMFVIVALDMGCEAAEEKQNQWWLLSGMLAAIFGGVAVGFAALCRGTGYDASASHAEWIAAAYSVYLLWVGWYTFPYDVHSADWIREDAPQARIDDKWVMARPLRRGWVSRSRAAWEVLRGRADALKWYKQ